MQNLTSLEDRYYREVARGKFKKPKGLSEDIYELNKRYYSQEFFAKADRTANKYLQTLNEQKQRQNIEEIEKSRRNAIAAAQAQASTNAMLNSILQSNNQNISHGLQNLNKGAHISNVTPMSPTGPASVDVYNVQRINDNMYGIQKVR